MQYIFQKNIFNIYGILQTCEKEKLNEQSLHFHMHAVKIKEAFYHHIVITILAVVMLKIKRKNIM